MPEDEKIKTIPVRIPEAMHKEFSKKLIDDDMSAQTFFIEKVEEYLKQKPKKK